MNDNNNFEFIYLSLIPEIFISIGLLRIGYVPEVLLITRKDKLVRIWHLFKKEQEPETSNEISFSHPHAVKKIISEFGCTKITAIKYLKDLIQSGVRTERAFYYLYDNGEGLEPKQLKGGGV